MGSRRQDAARQIPLDLRRAQARFAAWRGRRRRGARIPPSLWTVATELAGRYGVARTAAALKVDYYGLKRRLSPAPAHTPAKNTPFVEIPSPWLPSGGQCRIELEDDGGRRLRVELSGCLAAEVGQLVCALWSER